MNQNISLHEMLRLMDHLLDLLNGMSRDVVFDGLLVIDDIGLAWGDWRLFAPGTPPSCSLGNALQCKDSLPGYSPLLDAGLEEDGHALSYYRHNLIRSTDASASHCLIHHTICPSSP